MPRADGALLVVPDGDELTRLPSRNRQRLDASRVDIQGRSLAELRESCRREALDEAANWMADVHGSAPTIDPQSPLVATGHQPSLFHCGVWMKNFVVAELARRCDGIGLNLIVDNDLLSSRSLRVPTGNRDEPETIELACDVHHESRPWEEASIEDSGVFESFAGRLVDALRPWGIAPVAESLWSDVVGHAHHSDRLGECLTAGRSRLEWSWGCRNLELPLSRLCRTDPFRWFAAHVMARAGEFRTLHNAALEDFRRRHRIRSRTHPVPALEIGDAGVEIPFWIWQAGEGQRHRVSVRESGPKVELVAAGETLLRMPLTRAGDACCAVEELRGLEERGFRLRPRALGTTLFVRLFLADLFVHGIGGARYDELTDRIAVQFLGISPPEFAVATGTLWMPLGELHQVDQAELARVPVRLRDLLYNAQRHLGGDRSSELDALLDEKQGLIEQQRGKSSDVATAPRERFDRFKQINQALANHVEPQRQQLLGQLADIRRRLRANDVLANREYAFCLYPETMLREFMGRVGNDGRSDAGN